MKKLIILFSGRGSNMLRIIEKVNQEPAIEIVAAITNKADAPGIEKAKAISCLEDQEKALSLVEKFQFHVKRDNIESTPTFIINGKKYTNRSYDELKKIIDKELDN